MFKWLVFLVLAIPLFACSATASTPAAPEIDYDQLIYDSCVERLPDAVTVEYATEAGEPDHYLIDLNEFVLCGDYVSDFRMKDLAAVTKITYTSDFTVITPDGEVIESPLESSITWEVYESDGMHYSTLDTYSIDGLTGFSKIELPECGAPYVGIPGTLVIFRCEPK
jgi:hypothetical protein